MASIKELRQRIKSVGSIKQITRAMEMVSTTKLRRFQDRTLASRPYTEEITGLVERLTGMLGEELAQRPLFRTGEGTRSLVLVVSSDRGLCGAYNSKLLRILEAWRAGRARDDVHYFVIGRKAFQYMDRRDFEVDRFLTEPKLEAMAYSDAALVARMLMSEFLKGFYRDVWILYTAFESMVKYVPTILPFLPVSGPEDGGQPLKGNPILEPDAQTIFEHLIPRYLETRIYNALLEALTSEYASRRFAMKNATDAATDMQDALRGTYNRKRQESITKDLLDIIGAAEAVR
jgi:F-type H+-transporting ATPase subunit gamma